MGKKPADLVKTLLGKLDLVRSSKERGSNVSSKSKVLFHKFMEQIEKVFKNRKFSISWGKSSEVELEMIRTLFYQECFSWIRNSGIWLGLISSRKKIFYRAWYPRDLWRYMRGGVMIIRPKILFYLYQISSKQY